MGILSHGLPVSIKGIGIAFPASERAEEMKKFVASKFRLVYELFASSPDHQGSAATNAQRSNRLEYEISRAEATYAKKDKVKYILLGIYGTGEGAVLGGVLGGEKTKNLMGCASAWSTLILSGLVSVSIIVALVLGFFQQFGLLKLGKQLQQELDSLLPNDIPATTKRSRFPNNKNTYFKKTSALYWWLERAVFLVVLIGISICLLVSFIGIIC